jgi:hypothetical protein
LEFKTRVLLFPKNDSIYRDAGLQPIIPRDNPVVTRGKRPACVVVCFGFVLGGEAVLNVSIAILTEIVPPLRRNNR